VAPAPPSAARRLGVHALRQRRRNRARTIRLLVVVAVLVVAAVRLDAVGAARDGHARVKAWQAARVCAWASAARAWDAISDGHLPPLPSCGATGPR
jgi:hypothetical protein